MVFKQVQQENGRKEIEKREYGKPCKTNAKKTECT